jgi:hypothetical protein
MMTNSRYPSGRAARIDFSGACYWDIESGGLDLEQRGHADTWQQAAGTGIPRDGGLADLLREAASPQPRFAAVICEDMRTSSDPAGTCSTP